jgi:ATP-dependent Clp protease ATP-binding subunit ClpC
MRAQDIAAHFTRRAIGRLVDQGYEPRYGARPMRRTIQREVDNHLSEMMLDGRLSPGQEVRVDAGDDGALTFEVAPRLETAPAG